MNLLAPLRRKPESRSVENYIQWLQQSFGSFGFQGSQFPLGVNTTVPGSKTEPIGDNFAAYVNGGLRNNGIVWTLEQIRVQVFTQARFRYQALAKGRPGDLFGGPELDALERANHALHLLDADLAGNSYTTLIDDEVVRLRPDWVDLILERRPSPVGTLGYVKRGIVYWEDGKRDGKARVLLPGEFAHFAPMPDPLANYRGMSWLTPVVRELMGDDAYTRHKTTFIDNSATPNLAVTLKESVTPAQFEEFVDAMEASHAGPQNAGKTLYLAGGADVTVVGSTMQQLDFKAVQGAGETRLAAASGVGSVIAQFSEGMQGSSLNAGNYAAARRRFADVTVRHLWQEAAKAYSDLFPPPRSTRLWYDASTVSFLQEDESDAADIRQKDAITLRNLVDAGFDADAAVAFLQSGGDLSKLLGKHSGLFSVQLQEPGTSKPPETDSEPPTEETPPNA